MRAAELEAGQRAQDDAHQEAGLMKHARRWSKRSKMAIRRIIEMRREELAAAIRTAAQARVDQLKS
jgi:hypothetical protein